jgi:hypothetical protein
MVFATVRTRSVLGSSAPTVASGVRQGRDDELLCNLDSRPGTHLLSDLEAISIASNLMMRSHIPFKSKDNTLFGSLPPAFISSIKSVDA